jgi:acyl carrier protein
MFNRTVEPEYREMRKNVLAQISAERLTEDSQLSKVLDSLELVELTMEAEESGVEPAVEIKTVRDFLWLCRAIDFQRQRKKRPKSG